MSHKAGILEAPSIPFQELLSLFGMELGTFSSTTLPSPFPEMNFGN